MALLARLGMRLDFDDNIDSADDGSDFDSETADDSESERGSSVIAGGTGSGAAVELTMRR